MSQPDETNTGTNWRDNIPQPDIPNIGVGDGWRGLVEAAATLIKPHPCLSFGQIKEKFGGLRIYLDHDFECPHVGTHGCRHHGNAAAHMEALEVASLRTCEQCGRYGRYGKPRTGGWIKTRCDECQEAHGG